MGQVATKDQLVDLLTEELRLGKGCIGECQDKENTVLCLVEQHWLAGVVSSGLVSSPFYDGDHTSVAWLQAALHEHGTLLDGWQRVAIRIIVKPTSSQRAARMLVPPCVPQLTVNMVSGEVITHEQPHYVDGLSWLNEHVRRSQAAIVSGAIASDGSSQTENFPPVTSITAMFVQQVLDQMYGGVKLQQVEHCDLPSLVPPVDPPPPCSPGLLPVVGALESSKAFYIIHSSPPPTLRQAVSYSPSFLTSSMSRPLFIIYQLLQVLCECHCFGATHDGLDLDGLLLDTDLWVQVYQLRYGVTFASTSSPPAAALPVEPAPVSVPRPLSSPDHLAGLVQDWINGALSNYDYLMALNSFAGRWRGNPNQHPVLPWVVDFSEANGGWRDLSRSKFRLNKGDDQLDFTFTSQSPPLGSSLSTASPALLPPHHVSDVLSDITFYVYLARRMPRSVLCRYVRSKWVPHEYPTSMHRMMLWTPDECIPELFTDPTVFCSIHDDLADLELPSWTPSADQFIDWHRSMLESDQVSQNLHHWIDLTFGYQLSGRHAEKAKNVCLQLVQSHTKPCSHGVTQLFRRPHPARRLAVPVTAEDVLSSGLSCHGSDTVTCTRTRNPIALSESPPKPSAGFSSMLSQSIPEEVDTLAGSPTSLTSLQKDTGSVGSAGRSQHTASAGDIEYGMEVAPGAAIGSDVAAGEADVSGNEEDDIVQFEVEYPSTQVFEMKSRAKTPSKKEKEDKVPKPEVEAAIAKDPGDTVPVGQVSYEETIMPKVSRTEKASIFSASIQPTPTSRPLGLFGGRTTKDGAADCLTKAIQLPESFQPLHLLDSMDAIDVFLADCQIPAKEKVVMENAGPWPAMAKSNKSTPGGRTRSFVERVQRDMQCLACVAVQMLLPGVRAVLLGETDLEKKIETVRRIASYRQSALPSCVRHAVSVLLDFKPSALSNYISDLQQPSVLPHAPGPQLSPLFSCFQFPTYFNKLYSFLRLLKLWRTHPPVDDMLGCDLHTSAEDVMQTMRVSSSFSIDIAVEASKHHQSQLVSMVAQLLPQLLPLLDAEAFSSLLLPHLMPLFSTIQSSAKVAAEAMCRLFDILSRRLGSQQTSHFFLKPLFGLLELMLHSQPADDARCLSLLLSTSFLNQVVNRFGLASFLDHFVPVLINIVTTPIFKKSSQVSSSSMAAGDKNKDKDKDKVISEEEHEAPTVAYSPFVQLCADALLWLSQLLGPTLSTQHITHAIMNQLYQCFPVSADVVSSGRYSSRHAMSAVQCLVNIVILYGEPLLLDDYIKRLLDMVRYNTTTGGMLTIKEQQRIAAALSFFRTLLPLLSQHVLLNCFEDFHQNLFYPTIKLLSSTVHCFPGGSIARSAVCHLLVDTLVVLGHRLGRDEAQHLLEFPLQQLFACFDPYAYKQEADTSCDRSDSPAAIGEEEVKALFTPALAHWAYIPLCQLIGQIRMRELIINHELIEQMAYGYDMQQHEIKMKLGEEYHSTWNMLATMSERAPVISSSFNVLAVGETLSDVEEIDVDLFDDVAAPPPATAFPKPDQSTQPWTVSIDNDTALVGDMKDLVRDFNPTDQSGGSRPGTGDSADSISSSLDHWSGQSAYTPGAGLDASSPFFRGVSAVEGHRHLAGSWLEQWTSTLGSRVWPFAFQQRKLQTFGGHSGTVRCLHVHPQEHLLLSGGRDKTVRLWSLANHGDGSSCMSSRHDYRGHQKSVSFVHLVERTGAVASFDGTLHLWDPESGHRLKVMEFNRTASAIASLPAPYPQLVTSTSDGVLKFVDVRVGRTQYEFKSLSQGGQVRSLCADASGHVIAVGYSTGYVGLLEQRTGVLLAFWRAHDADVLQIRSPAEHHLVTSSTDQTISLWQDNARHPSDRLAMFRGHTDPVHCLSFLNEHIISVSTSNRLGVHSSMDDQASFQSWKIRSENFRGGISSLGVLPMNKLLLLAGDSGQIAMVA